VTDKGIRNKNNRGEKNAYCRIFSIYAKKTVKKGEKWGGPSRRRYRNTLGEKDLLFGKRFPR